MGFKLDGLLLGAQVAVGLFQFGASQHVADLVGAVAGIENPDFVHDTAFDYAAVGTLDEPILVDTGKARKRRNQTDVGTFGSLNGTNPAVMCRMHVADFESGALARKAACPESGESPLVRDLRQRVGLVHELG